MISRHLPRYSGYSLDQSPDRYAKSQQMERRYAETWAQDDGRDLHRITQQTRDGGKDFVGSEGGTKVIGEVKHWGRPVDKYTLAKYVDTANEEEAKLAFGASNGLTDPAHKLAREHGVEILTDNDLPRAWYHRGMSLLVRGCKAGIKKSIDVGERAAELVQKIVIDGIVRAAWKWWKRLSLRQKVFMTVFTLLVAAIVYFGVKSHHKSDDAESFTEWLRTKLRI